MLRAFIIGWLFGKFFPRLAIVLIVMIVGAWLGGVFTFVHIAKTGLLMKGHSIPRNDFIKKQ